MTTNNFKTSLLATFAQFTMIRRGLALAQVQSTASRTVSEYSGLGKRVSEEILVNTPGSATDTVETARFSCNLEELKTMRRGVRKLMEQAVAEHVTAAVYGEMAVTEELLNGAVAGFNSKRLDGGKMGRADITA